VTGACFVILVKTWGKNVAIVFGPYKTHLEYQI